VEIEATRTAQHLRGMASSRGGGWKLLPVATPIVASPPVAVSLCSSISVCGSEAACDGDPIYAVTNSVDN